MKESMYNDYYTCYNRGVVKMCDTRPKPHDMYAKYITLTIVLVGLIIPLLAIAYPKQEEQVETPEPEPASVEVVQDGPIIIKSEPYVQPVIVKSEPPSLHRYDDIVRAHATKYGISYTLITAIISCENYGRDRYKQSDLYYSFTNEKLGIIKNEREYSWGLVQINLHYNPNVSLEQAQDPSFSIDFLAKNLAKGNHSWWSSYTNGCYKQYM